MADEAVRADLGEHLEGEDVQIHPLAHIDEVSFRSARRVKWRVPSHRGAVRHDRDQDEGIKRCPLDELDGPGPRRAADFEESKGPRRVDVTAGADDRRARRDLVEALEALQMVQVLWRAFKGLDA